MSEELLEEIKLILCEHVDERIAGPMADELIETVRDYDAAKNSNIGNFVWRRRRFARQSLKSPGRQGSVTSRAENPPSEPLNALQLAAKMASKDVFVPKNFETTQNFEQKIKELEEELKLKTENFEILKRDYEAKRQQYDIELETARLKNDINLIEKDITDYFQMLIDADKKLKFQCDEQVAREKTQYRISVNTEAIRIIKNRIDVFHRKNREIVAEQHKKEKSCEIDILKRLDALAFVVAQIMPRVINTSNMSVHDYEFIFEMMRTASGLKK